MSADQSATSRVVLHADMDAFFASVELLRRPELRHKPVVVGGDGPRGVIAAASYAARHYGVRSAMPSTTARRLCPDLIFLSAAHGHYSEVSRRVMAIFESYSPLVEALSLDEAFIDVTGAQRLFGDGATIAHDLRRQVYESEGLWCSVGVATAKFIAKMASERAKPSATPTGPKQGSGVFVVEPGTELAFIHPLPIRALWGVGPATHERLSRIGVVTIGDLAALPLQALRAAVGDASARHLSSLANAIDERDVTPGRQARSISHEETYQVDKRSHDDLNGDLVGYADAVARRLRAEGLSARTVTIKVRFGSFRTITRRLTLDEATDNGVELARTAKELLAAIDVDAGVRLLGVGATNLTERPAGRQLSLDDVLAAENGKADAGRWSEADAAIDEIRTKFGDKAIGPGAAGRRGRSPGGGRSPHAERPTSPQKGSPDGSNS